MKKIILCMLFLITAFGFSAEIKLGSQYNKDSVWSICTDLEELKDCKIIFIGNPYKEFKVYEAEDLHGMIIEYKNMAISETGGGDLIIVENKALSVPKKSNLSALDKKVAKFGGISILAKNEATSGYLEVSEYKNLKKSGKNIFYYNVIFTNHDVLDSTSFN